MTRRTMQDFLRSIGKPGVTPKITACCGQLREPYAIVELTPEEEERLGVAWACGACLAGPPVETVSVVDLDNPWGDNEIANGVRATRWRMLQASDWTQVPDTPLPIEKRDAWSVYRRALRDITETFDTPTDVVWPESPPQRN